jgi:hypothetical protein
VNAPLVLLCLLAPATAFGQTAITGIVGDSSGAGLPRVSVEASSASLIEKTRAVVTDDAGRYRIEDLRPGTYQVTFTLAGFRPYRQQKIELAGSFTAVVNARLDVGAPDTIVTVTATSPLVDVRRTRHEITLGGEHVKSLPTARSYNALLSLIPGVVTANNDIVTGTATTAFPIHGGRAQEGRMMLDGLNVGSPPAGNAAASYVVDTSEAEEVTFSSALGVGETETAGLVMNIVPKAGGNIRGGSASASGSRLSSVYDVSGTLGGPLLKDRVWYFANGHTGGSLRTMSSVYYNLHAGDPGQWLYEPDTSRPEYSDRTFENAGLRLTWQAAPRHKVGVFWDEQALCRTCTGATPGLSEPERISPEAVGVLGRPLHVAQATWSSPLTNRILLEAGFGGTEFGVGNFERQPNPTRGLIRVEEQCAGGCAANGGIPGLVYRSQDFSTASAGSYLWKGSFSYVTGARTLKVGYQHTFMTDDRRWMTNDQHLTYRVNNGVPNQLTESISPWVNNARVAWDGVFAQQQWTLRRVTLEAALRLDRAASWFPQQQEGPSRFLPKPIVIPETAGVDSYKDVTPRFGAAYDVAGNGRTALKVSLGKYLEGAGASGNYVNTNPTLRLPQTTMAFGTAGVTRAWIDANGNFVPDCDLLNPAAQDLRGSGSDLCGVMSNTNFGRPLLTNTFDGRLLDGWGIRPSDWTFRAAFEQEIFPHAAVSVEYTRRWFSGFSAADNTSIVSSDLTPFSIVAPIDARLPAGGGYAVSGLYDVVPGRFGQVSNLIADSTTFGAWWQQFNGVDVTFNARAGERFMASGGASTGETVADNCDVRAHLPELSTGVIGTSMFGAGLLGSAVTPLSPYCHVAFGMLTQFRGLSAYLVPKANVQISATFQSKPGAMLAANYTVPDAVVAPSLGRALSGNAPSVTVNLVPPGTMYGDRINELDLRVARTLRAGRSRSTVAIEIYNALNSRAVLAANNAFIPGGSWLQPIIALTPRFLKISGEVAF